MPVNEIAEPLLRQPMHKQRQKVKLHRKPAVRRLAIDPPPRASFPAQTFAVLPGSPCSMTEFENAKSKEASANVNARPSPATYSNPGCTVATGSGFTIVTRGENGAVCHMSSRPPMSMTVRQSLNCCASHRCRRSKMRHGSRLYSRYPKQRAFVSLRGNISGIKRCGRHSPTSRLC